VSCRLLVPSRPAALHRRAGALCRSARNRRAARLHHPAQPPISARLQPRALTCTGTLHTCLGREDAADLRAVIRAGGDDAHWSPRSAPRSTPSRRATTSTSAPGCGRQCAATCRPRALMTVCCSGAGRSRRLAERTFEPAPGPCGAQGFDHGPGCGAGAALSGPWRASGGRQGPSCGGRSRVDGCRRIAFLRR